MSARVTTRNLLFPGRGEGIAAIILKRASDCVDGRDSVRAVICASACNQDGGRSSSFTSPSTEAQEHLIRETYEMANLEMSATGYVEAHGTGTQAVGSNPDGDA